MSIQPVNKAVLGRKKQKKVVNAYLIKNSKGEKGGREGGGRTLPSSRKDWAELYGCIKWVSNNQS